MIENNQEDTNGVCTLITVQLYFVEDLFEEINWNYNVPFQVNSILNQQRG